MEPHIPQTPKKKLSPVVALREFFGYRPGDGIKEFSAEVKCLSEEKKLSLARLACEEMGCELEVKGPAAT